MQFITTGNRIAVENFTIGDLYTITFTNGNYINSACIGIGGNFVTFQRNEPELLFSLTMETAELVSTIDLYAGGSGTNNYNELTNKPQINDVELVGNKSLAAFGIQPEITEESPLSSALVSGLGSAAAADTSDFATAAQGALAASAVQPAALDAALALKQDALSSAQLAAVNSGITSAAVTQIETNKNNILSLTPTKSILRYAVTTADVYENSGLSFTIPANHTCIYWATVKYNNRQPTGILIATGDPTDTAKIYGKNEVNEMRGEITITGALISPSTTNDTVMSIYVKYATAGVTGNDVLLAYVDLG